MLGSCSGRVCGLGVVELVKSLVEHCETAAGFGVLIPPANQVGVLLTELLLLVL